MLSLNKILLDRKNIHVSISTASCLLWVGWTDRLRGRQAPGLHPSFGPEWFDFGLHEGLEVLLQGLRVLALQLVAAQFHPHQAAQQRPDKQSCAESLTAVHFNRAHLPKCTIDARKPTWACRPRWTSSEDPWLSCLVFPRHRLPSHSSLLPPTAACERGGVQVLGHRCCCN